MGMGDFDRVAPAEGLKLNSGMETPRMLAVIYRWRVAPGKEQQFQVAWEFVTREFLANAGSLGSRLHRSSDGMWVAYAQWPDRDSWERATASSDEGRLALDSLSSVVLKTFEPLLLEPVADYLVGKETT